MKYKKQKTVALVMCLLMLPMVALASEEEDRLAALEARVAALEAQMEALLSEQTAEKETEIVPFEMGEALTLEEGRVMTVSSFETGSRFRYSPTGGFTTQALSAKAGYQLLCLYMRVENNRDEALQVSKLVNAVLSYGEEYTNQAQTNFFYLNSRGGFSGGLRAIGPQTVVDGCLLFALPSEAQDDTKRISIQLSYNDTLYECTLRQSGALLEALQDGQMQQY